MENPIPIFEKPSLTILQQDTHFYNIFFRDASLQTIDLWINQVARINAAYTSEELVRYLVDTTQLPQILPLLYVLRRSQDYVNTHPHRPRTRTLVLYPPVTSRTPLHLLNILTNWISTQPHEKAYFISVTEREAGMKWLRMS